MDYTNLIDKVNIPELVKALRNHASKESDCRSCKYYYYNIVKYDTCSSSLCAAAASAIEELQQIADRHEQTAKDYWKEACEYKAELPKRGKWIRIDKHTVQCSLCHRYLDLRGVNAGRSDANYCPNCGADMNAKIETQDESISKFADGEWWKEVRK